MPRRKTRNCSSTSWRRPGSRVGSRVADLCTGSGVVAIAASHEQGAREVTAFDICPRAVQCARTNALTAGVDVEVHLGSWARAVEFGPYDLVVCNPPYVPHDPALGRARAPVAYRTGACLGCRLRRPSCPRPAVRGSTRTCSPTAARCCWCNPSSPDRARRLRRWPPSASTPKSLPTSGFRSAPCCRRAREWLEDTGRLEPGRREEELVVIRADKP